MTKLRSILFYFGQAASTIPFLFISIIALLVPAYRRSELIAGWAKFVIWWLKITCGLKHQVSGEINIPQTPCVFACAHQSTWETISTQTFLPPLAWVLKKELLKIPFFGWGLWATGPIAIDRSDRRRALDQVIEQGVKKFEERRYVLIFPEGTRTPYGEKGRYKKGAAQLAKAGNVPIVPIAHNAGKFWSNTSPWIKPGVIDCVFGPKINTKDKTDQEITDEIQSWIESQNL